MVDELGPARQATREAIMFEDGGNEAREPVLQNVHPAPSFRAASMTSKAREPGEVIVPSGVAAANILGFATQVPVKWVCLTSERSRILSLGKQGDQFGRQAAAF